MSLRVFRVWADRTVERQEAGDVRVSKSFRRDVVMRLASAVALALIALPGGIAQADPSSWGEVPICGDQADGDLITNCTAEWSPLVDVQTFQVPGGGAQKLVFDFVFRGGIYDNELAVFSVDASDGRIGDVAPGQAGYQKAAINRATVVFPSGSTAFSPDATVNLQGGSYVAFVLVVNGTLASLQEGAAQAVWSLDAMNVGGRDNFLGFRNVSGTLTQFSFEDIPDGGDNDFDDVVFTVSPALGGGQIHGGEKNGVFYAYGEHPPGEACTTGFPVQRYRIDFMLTAGHCRTVDKLGIIFGTVRILNGWERTDPVWAKAIACDEPKKTLNPRCLAPKHPENTTYHDVMAWRPDTESISNLIRTGQGLLPMLGAAAWQKGQVAYWYGQKTLEITGRGEVCGHIRGFLNKYKLTIMDGLLGTEGDSGGPVYEYVRDANGRPIGVRVLGIQISHAPLKKTKDFPSGDYVQFNAVEQIENQLEVKVPEAPGAPAGTLDTACPGT